ncbi:MAG: tetratricopeptide repeat protein [Ardenticatenaceae bacterium]
MQTSQKPWRAVILTALEVEYMAVRAHLTELKEEIHSSGTIYERGTFWANEHTWEVGIVEIGAGNTTAALEAQSAIQHFNPEVIFFVGVAGGVKDVKLGDVVIATKIYDYESGKAGEAFRPRPQLGNSSRALVQRARVERRPKNWLQRIKPQLSNQRPKVFIGPIAAGEKVVASTESATAQLLRDNYSDTLAVEMEGYGFLQAVQAYPQVQALVIRGISDLIDGKSQADAEGWQETASRHASAFAFEVLAKWKPAPLPGLRQVPPTSRSDEVVQQVEQESKVPSISSNELLSQATCIVFNGDEIGTGWLVSNEGHLLTAGHVLGREQPVDQVEVQFKGGRRVCAQRVEWMFDKEQELDFAVLKLAQSIQRRPLLISLAEEVEGICRLCGYGTDLRRLAQSIGKGQFSGSMVIAGPSSKHLFEISSSELGKEGNSGGAVFSDNLQKVVAIQTETATRRVGSEANIVLAVALYRVAKFWEPLKELANEPKSEELKRIPTVGKIPPKPPKVKAIVPMQIPRRPKHFTGREERLEQLLAALRPGQVITLCGPGGIGKSALAVEAIWRLAPNNTPPEAFQDGIIFHDFYKEPLASQALDKIARIFGERSGQSTPKIVARILSDKKALLVLDGAEKADDLEKVVEARGNCAVLITSRDRKHKFDERLDIDSLPTDKAVTLLQKWGGKWAFDEIASQKICQLVGRLPLAVRLVGRYLDSGSQNAVEYLKWLQETPLKALNQGKRELESVSVLLDKSLQQVSEEAREALAVVGLLGLAPFSSQIVGDVLDMPPFAAGPLLAELVRYGLLVRRDDYEVTHALIHTYAQKRLFKSDGKSKDERIERFIAYYFKFVQEAAGKEVVGPSHPHILKALARVKENVAQQGDSARQLMVEFVNAIDPYWEAHNQYQVQVKWLKEAYECASLLEQPIAQASFAHRIGCALRALGQLEEALSWMSRAESNLDGIESIDANTHRALIYVRRAAILYLRGKLDQAKADCERGLDMVNQTEYPAAVAEGYNLLAAILGRSGEHQKAIHSAKKSLAIWEELGNQYQIARTKDNIVTSYVHLGHINQARKFDERSLEYWETSPDQSRRALALTNSGVVTYMWGQCLTMAGLPQEALQEYQIAAANHEQAAQISEDLGLQRLLALARMNKAWPHIARENWDKAASNLEQSLEIQQHLNLNVYLAETYRAQAEVAIGQKQFSRAIRLAKQALGEAQSKDEKSEEANAHRVLGKAYRLSGKPTLAQEHLEKSLAELTKLKNVFEMSLTLQELASLYKRRMLTGKHKSTKAELEDMLRKMGVSLPDNQSSNN